VTCTSTRARPLSRGLSRSWEARRTRSRGRKLGFGLFGVVGAVLVMAGPAAAEGLTPGDNNALLASLWLIVAAVDCQVPIRKPTTRRHADRTVV